MNANMSNHPVVAEAEWIAARKQLLEREKEQTHLRDEINRQRRALPWVKVEKNYVFDGPDGKVTLGDLFDGRSQLIVQHFMLAPDWEEGCVGCSFGLDHVVGALVHLEHHDVSFAVVSRAPLSGIEAYRHRMAWDVRWVSSFESDFNYDFHVSFRPEEMASGKVIYNYEEQAAEIEELPGSSVFYKNAAGEIFHTYSVYGRGGEEVISAYMLLDFTPKGRNETGPNHNLTDWVKRHDSYEDDGRKAQDKAAVSQACCGATDTH